MERLVISSEEAQRIRDAFVPLVGIDPYDEKSLSTIRKATFSSCPERLIGKVVGLGTRRSASGCLLAQRVFEQSELPPTPTEPSVVAKTKLSLFSEGLVLGIALTLGEPVAYQAEKNGALVQQVFPVRSKQDAPSNESSASMLNLHTELVFSRRHPKRPLDADSPDFILLLCLRSDPKREAVTLVAEIRDICSGLPAAHLSVLRQPRYELRAPYSFTEDNPDARPWVGPVSLLGLSTTLPTAAFDLACGTRGLDLEAEQALEALREAAVVPQVISRIVLEAGDILILDNRRCAHGRTPFFAAYDGNDRWIQRVYVRNSLENMKPVDASQSLRVF